jgi:hypothetical protein
LPELSEYSNSLEKTIKDTDLQNVSIGLSEVFLDELMDNGIVKDIPIIGTVVGLGKATLGIKERLFLKKIIYFISELKNIPPDKRRRMIDKIDSSGKFRTKVGEKLLFIIDSCEDHEKAQVIARLFASFISQKLSYQEFLRSSCIVERTMLEDLNWFVDYEYDDFMFEEVGDLINSGLFSLEIVDPHDYDHKVPRGLELRVYLNEIGKKIRDVLKK